jgi:hypothetical protein
MWPNTQQNNKQQTKAIYDIHIYQNIQPTMLDYQSNDINIINKVYNIIFF